MEQKGQWVLQAVQEIMELMDILGILTGRLNYYILIDFIVKKIVLNILVIFLFTGTSLFSKANNLALDLASDKKKPENSIGRSSSSEQGKFYIGAFPGFNLSAASTNSVGLSFSPQFDIRPEYLFKKHFGVFANLGYQQSRYKFSKTILRADFFKSAFYFRYHYAIKKLKIILPFVYTGLYQKTRVSSEFENISSKSIYNADDYTSSFLAGITIGLGAELNLLKLLVPVATLSYNKSFTNRLNKVNTKEVKLSASKDYSLDFSFGIKIKIK